MDKAKNDALLLIQNSYAELVLLIESARSELQADRESWEGITSAVVAPDEIQPEEELAGISIREERLDALFNKILASQKELEKLLAENSGELRSGIVEEQIQTLETFKKELYSI